jgi:hypothetical protein
MNVPALSAAVAAALIIAGPTGAETLRSTTTFNTGDQKQTQQQPADGVAVTYPITYSGGALDGCTAEVAETLYPRDEGNWGIYELAADVTCADGGFAFTSAGSWDAKGFHGAGKVTEGSGTGSFEGLAGRLAQSGGSTSAADNTSDISYEIMIDRAAP